ncbi:MAG: long-chain-fatty-acid--CoA ligase [Euryarchaeota archaeon]|nr:long-chain-fatty-acid--CoA ligase [Euryarchaeota archaeon]
MLLTDILDRNARLYPREQAVVFEGQRATHAEFQSQVHRLAHGLRGLGLQRGDRAAILSKNCPEFLQFYFACAALGAVAVPLNYRLTPGEMEYILQDSKARLLLAGEGYLPAAKELRRRAPQIEKIISLERDAETAAYGELLASAPETPPDADTDENRVIWMMYTSGTTGRPKGALVTHRTILSTLAATLLDLRVDPGDRMLVTAPQFHVAAVIASLRATARGATLHLHREFDPRRVIDTIERERITHTLLVPAMLQMVLQVPNVEKRDFSSLKLISYGAAPMPVEVLKKGLRLIGPKFAQGYGQTEAPVLTSLRPEEHTLEGAGAKRLASCGREIFGVTIRIARENGEEAPPGEVGEIRARGDGVMKGYWNLPDATQKTLDGGWLHTGDMAYRDPEGYIYIVDRLKDMVISGGENIYPREIEEALFAHPAIADAAAIGVPHEKWGEAVHAFVVLQKGTRATEQELLEHCRKSLAKYKCPQRIEFIPELPRNPSGKVLKRVLREPYWKGMERRV